MRHTLRPGLLSAFGFSALEEEAYSALLGNPSQTGYKLAQLIKKPVANLYKALESLHDKGAVMVEDGDPARYRAAPVAELFHQFEVQFRRKRKLALRKFAGHTPRQDERVYRIGSRDLCLQRARKMISAARRTILIDVFPNVLPELSKQIAAAARRVAVVGLVYAPVSIPKARLSLSPVRDRALERWPGDWLNIVADGKQLLIALLERSGPGLHQAIWTASPYLAWTYQVSMFSEILLARLEEDIHKGASKAKLLRLIRDYRKAYIQDAPGYRSLPSKLGPGI